MSRIPTIRSKIALPTSRASQIENVPPASNDIKILHQPERPNFKDAKRQAMRKSILTAQTLLNTNRIIKQSRKSVKRPAVTLSNGAPPAKVLKPAGNLPPILRPVLVSRSVNVLKDNTNILSKRTAGTVKESVSKPIVAKPAPYDFKAKYNLLLEKHKDLKSQFADVQSQLKDAESTWEDQITSSENEVICFKNNLEQKIKELQKLNDNYQKLQSQYKASQSEVADLKNKLEFSNVQVKDYKEKLNETENKLTHLNSDYQQLENRLGSSQSEIKELTSKLEVSNKDILLLKEKLNNTENKLASLNTDHQQLQIRFESSQSDIVNITIKLESSNKEVQDLTEKLTTTEHKLNNLREEQQQLQTRFGSSQTEIFDLTNKLSHLQNQYKISCDDNDSMKREIRECKKSIQGYESERKILHNKIQDLKGNIRVFCRIRPPLATESTKTLCNFSVVDDNNLRFKSQESSKRLENAKTDFNFDHVFGPNASQQYVFKEVAHLVQSALDGYNICIVAYGQTGSGKTFTMTGAEGDSNGIIPRTAELIFGSMPKLKELGWDYTVKAMFLEVYNERIRDLMVPNDKSDHDIRRSESNSKEIIITNTTVVPIQNAEELKGYITRAQKNRATAVTDFNEHSSRSHSITKIIIEGTNSVTSEECYSSINLVDLAGSEKASIEKSDRLAETKNINKSLSNLSSVIFALLNKNDHVPYRNSKLTYLLMPCLGGNAKTLMLVNVSSLDDCWAESIHTLRFGSQVKSVKLAAANKSRCAPNTST